MMVSIGALLLLMVTMRTFGLRLWAEKTREIAIIDRTRNACRHRQPELPHIY